MQRIAQPDQLGGRVVAKQREQGRLDLVVAPAGEKVTRSAVALGVAPVQVGDDERVCCLEKQREARVEENAGSDEMVDPGEQ